MSIGIWQIVLILVLVLILFGAGKLPRVMGDVAKGIKSFKAGMKDEETENNSSSSQDPKVLNKPQDARMADEVRRDEVSGPKA
ncbi:MAG: twin-arginine translocase TatA/TatE family subunit [Tistrella sp.]|jgi:sec-independent protein translocase protein TatA|uniref:Sec-independent protein translocase protein TatA n=2 Tax=Tistrella mobilis TaxID=171437 RepID=I3TKT7_TISMK|nr:MULTISPECIES: twin-arginine translocase TatA/TatE family subunit [Tistrella]AFK53375.1 Sec-independent protein translocase protein tatA/E-like protein [Tistrella mobilis KA081020-065]KYO57651.1 preprotein translocase subunit TatA [Tistrella mobilis]MAD36641.1 twin-arginine translocase TatA/TatE family subunit [Tistrella sp.]MAM74029.1 twin-arginine translocase TatA/TatE family subunit [Tistrella sp.]MBA75748.1 twin-arginine translocase TatA/TatE family subunit [Tistrella sp.]|tara:strand:+ start:121 stop:369 length:249 start_codon:yes stop_codon:yes gene_type:complete